ncbi:TPA: hypothetical protein N2899_002258 [Vibrio parahaemolyticus]|nr:hypothetical protein [Vibrio parahaemolyticus]
MASNEETEKNEVSSIEILGQKFSYPTTWKGVCSIAVVGATICYIAYQMTPERIRALSELLKEKKILESSLVNANNAVTATQNELNVFKSVVNDSTESPEVDSDGEKAYSKTLVDVMTQKSQKLKEASTEGTRARKIYEDSIRNLQWETNSSVLLSESFMKPIPADVKLNRSISERLISSDVLEKTDED